MKDTSILAFWMLVVADQCSAFMVPSQPRIANPALVNCATPSALSAADRNRAVKTITSQLMMMSGGSNDEEDSIPDPDGAEMAAQLFQMAQAKGVRLDEDDLMDDDDEDNDDSNDLSSGNGYDYDDDDDEEEMNFPQGAINAFLGYDTGDMGERLAGNVGLTDDQLYSEVKERVLDTAGGFVDMVSGPDEDYEDVEDTGTPKPYEPPTTVPDSALTAGEVVLLVLEALKNNDNPTVNRGAEILFGYSSSGSQIKNEEGLTPAEYADFLKETEYKVLFEHERVVSRDLKRWLVFWYFVVGTGGMPSLLHHRSFLYSMSHLRAFPWADH